MTSTHIIGVEGLRKIAAVVVDHRACPPEVHDTSLPDGWTPDHEQAALPGGKEIACNDCRKALFYCRRDENWHHADPDAECFLCGPWSAPFGWLTAHDTGMAGRPATAEEWVTSTRSKMAGEGIYPGTFINPDSGRLVYVEGGPDLPGMPR